MFGPTLVFAASRVPSLQHRLAAFLLGGAAALGSLALWSAPAAAQAPGAGPKDEEAKKLAEEAIFTDYLATEFTAAQEKLAGALDLCGTDQCSAGVVARIHRDLGVVLVAGLQDPENGKAELVLALQADPSITLDKDLATPELETAFAQARQEVTGATGAPPAGQPPGGQPPASGLAEGTIPPELQSGTSEADEVVCPPDFPGCGEQDEGFEGSFCDAASPCPEGYDCVDNKCEEVEIPISEEAMRKNWVGLGAQQDWLLLTSGKDLCWSDYYCFYRDTDRYYMDEFGSIAKSADNPGQEVGDKLDSLGAVLATTRVMIAFDRAVSNNISLGARVGFAFRGGGPQAPSGNAFVPIHAEVRGTLWFGKGVFNKVGFRPFLFAGGGLAQVDAKVPIPARGDAVDATGKPVQTPLNLDAWRKTGLSFVSAGLGTGYAFSPSFYLFLEAKALQLLGASGTAGALQLGGAYGF
ncbi:MAG: hypothetical protein JW940_35125 [Polyangiaceae bacterium]|nr:hypothetical protein [Polyangiaceae bacterium]